MSHRDSRRPVHSDATASRVFSGEAVVISPAENVVRMLNSVGSRIWELADGQRTMAGIVDVLLDEYAVDLVTAESAVGGFVDELVAKGMLAYAE